MDEDTGKEILAELRKQTALINRLVLLSQTDLILREVYDLTGKVRTTEELHESLSSGYKAAIDYLNTFSLIEKQQLIEALEKSLGV